MNRHFTNTALLLVLSGALAACGTINVSVDVLDPDHVRSEMSEVSVRKLQREIFAAQPEAYAKQIDIRFHSFKTEVEILADKVRKTADALPAAQRPPVIAAADNLVKGVQPNGDFSQRAYRAGQKLESLAQSVRDESAKLRFDGQHQMPAQVRALLQDFRATESATRVEQVQFVRAAELNLRHRLATATEAAAKAAANAAPAAAASSVEASTAKAVTVAVAAPAAAATVQANVAAATASRSIIGDGSLAATEFAYVVANAPESLWRGDFNRAYASTTMGNSDMVIRLNSTADFSVKGLLFDASKVAQVASKVLTQTVLVGAQIAGVPVPTASTGTQNGGDALSKSSSDLAAADAVLAARDANAAAQKSAARSLARSLIYAHQQLGSAALSAKPPTDAYRAAIHAGIDTTVTSLKNILALQGSQ